jgi:hypothetical protein
MGKLEYRRQETEWELPKVAPHGQEPVASCEGG